VFDIGRKGYRRGAAEGQRADYIGIMPRGRSLVAAAVLLVSPGARSAPPDDLARQVTIYRDSYGIPHVFGETDASTMFGFAYAQAEDNFWRIEDNYIRSLGRAAEAHGERAVTGDRRNRALEIPRLARAEYARLPRRMQELVDGFTAGLNAYLAHHPEVRPRLLTRFEPWYPLAFIRYNYYQNGFFWSAGRCSSSTRICRSLVRARCTRVTSRATRGGTSRATPGWASRFRTWDTMRVWAG